MEAATHEYISADPYYEELNRLFNLYRLANLNTRYYGCRAEKFENWSKRAAAVIALLSAVALWILLGIEGPSVKYAAAILTGLSAVISGVTPFFGWSEKIRDLRALRFAYSQLFGQIECAITEIKRAGAISPEHVGMARAILDAYSRIEALDEMEPDKTLLDREDAKVREAFPTDYLWTHF